MTEEEKGFKAQRYFLTGPMKGHTLKHFEETVERLIDYYGNKLVCVRGRRELHDTKNNYDHYHLFLQFDRQIVFSKLKKVLNLGNPHNRKVAKDNVETTAHYCVKGACGDATCEHTWKSHGEKKCFEFNPKSRAKEVVLKYGEVAKEGQRTDLVEAAELIQAKPNWNAVVNDPALQIILARYSNWAKEVFGAKPVKEMKEPDWYDWQKEMIAILEEEPDDRTIHWVWDYDGGKGKSTLAKFLVRNKGACVLNGKAADMLYGYSKTLNPIVVIEVPREMLRWVSYAAIEKIKDGLYFNSKYQSQMVARDYEAHVVVFANAPPPEGKFSEDRLRIHNLCTDEEQARYDADDEGYLW